MSNTATKTDVDQNPGAPSETPEAFVPGPVGIQEHDIEMGASSDLPPAAPVDAAHGQGIEAFAWKHSSAVGSTSQSSQSSVPLAHLTLAKPSEQATPSRASVATTPPASNPQEPPQPPPTSEVMGPPSQVEKIGKPTTAVGSLASSTAVFPVPLAGTSPTQIGPNGRMESVPQPPPPSSRKRFAVVIVGVVGLVIVGVGLWFASTVVTIPGLSRPKPQGEEQVPIVESPCVLGTRACEGNSVTVCAAPGTHGNSNPQNDFVIAETCIGGIEGCVEGKCQVTTQGAACVVGNVTVQHGARACESLSDCRVCNNGSLTTNIGAGSLGCPWPCDRHIEPVDIPACPGEAGCRESSTCQRLNTSAKKYVCGYNSTGNCKSCVEETNIPACTNDYQCPDGYRCLNGACETHTFCTDGCCDVGTRFPGCYLVHYRSINAQAVTITETIVASGVQQACVGNVVCGAERIEVVCSPRGMVDQWEKRNTASCSSPESSVNLPSLVCNASCSAGGCPVGQVCLQGYCRNPQCASETDCACDSTQETLACQALTNSSSEAPTIGSAVSFRCAANRAGANHFEFRYRIDMGDFVSLAESTVGSGISTELQLLAPGRYEVQCRACRSPDSSDCTPFQAVGR